MSTDRVEEAKEEQIEVEVEEETPDAAVAADVRQLDQKVMKSLVFRKKISIFMWINITWYLAILTSMFS